MQVDTYQYCPCGSGKKIKFCKCADNFKDLDKIDRMISGGQLVAALDRINTLLKTNSSAAWLLALKAQILFQLREFESLSETAQRFWKLKPDNQLALWLMTISEIFRDPSSMVPAKYFLDGVAEVRDTVHPFGQTAGLMLAERLFMEGRALSALVIADLVAGLFKTEAPMTMVEEISHDPSVPTLLRIPSDPLDKPTQVAWAERFQEVRSLLRSHRISQAHAKLQSLNRDFPDQPVLTSMLLFCEVYRCDNAAAARYAEKLAKNETLSANQRSYYQALAFLLDPVSTGVALNQTGLLFELTDSQHETASNQLALLPELFHNEFADEELKTECANFIGEEIGPKSIYNVFSPISLDIDGEKIEGHIAVGMVALFGKQTDHPARLLVRYYPYSRELDSVFDELLKKLGLSRNDSKFTRQSEIRPVSASALLNIFFKEDTDSSFEAGLNLEIHKKRVRAAFGQRIADIPLACLDGKTPREVAGDDQYQTKVAGLLLFFQSHEDMRLSQADYESYANMLQIPPAEKVKLDTSAMQITPSTLYRIDIAALEPEAALRFAMYVFEMKLNSLTPEVLARLKRGDFPAENADTVKELSHLFRLGMGEDLDTRLTILEELIELRATRTNPVGELVLSGVNFLAAAGRKEESQAWFSKYMRKFPEDPHLVAFLQQVMAYAGQQGAPLSPNLPVRPSAETEGGLWIPGQSAPSAAPTSGTTPPSSSANTGSKLWIPGMD